MRTANRKDKNTKEIQDSIVKNGWQYIDTHDVGNGFPDCIAIKKTGKIFISTFIEIKSPSGELTESQIAFHDKHKGLVYVCKTKFDVTKVLRGYERSLRKEMKRERIMQNSARVEKARLPNNTD